MGLPDDHELPDAALYERAATGDVASLDHLLARYLPKLRAYVHTRLSSSVRARESSMDVVQSVCRELLAHRETFDFRGEERFRAWLFTAALNKLRDKHRFHRGERRDVRKERPGAASAEVVAGFATPSQDAMAVEAGSIVGAALDALSEDHREVITLARIVGLPHKVIAELLGRSEEATRQLLGRAMLQLARELRSRGLEPA